jgi:hypothetical protein
MLGNVLLHRLQLRLTHDQLRKKKRHPDGRQRNHGPERGMECRRQSRLLQSLELRQSTAVAACRDSRSMRALARGLLELMRLQQSRPTGDMARQASRAERRREEQAIVGSAHSCGGVLCSKGQNSCDGEGVSLYM